MIDDPDQARRLARAICSDIKLYNETALLAVAAAERARILADPVAEGYGLFVSRVSPPHHGVFEDAACAMYASFGATWTGLPIASGPGATAHPPVPRREVVSSPAAPVFLVLAVAGLALAVGAAAFLVLAR